MTKRITVIQGHPDTDKEHLDHALAASYISGAKKGGHEIRIVEVALLDFPIIRCQKDWDSGAVPADIVEAQDKIRWADHLLIVYPLWMGTMPALFKAFLEQVFRPGFAFEQQQNCPPKKALERKSCRVVVTMGMPAFIYRWYFGAHSVKNLKRNILLFCGIRPVRTSLFGMVDNPKRRTKWLKIMRDLGQAAS